MSILSLSKEYTEAWLAVSEVELLAFGGLVLIGIIGEILADKEAKVRLKRKNLRILEEFENLRRLPSVSFWKKHKMRFGVLVAIGILGECVCDGGVWFFSMKLQDVSRRENSVLQEQARKFERDAQAFRWKSDNLEKDLAQLEFSKLPRAYQFDWTAFRNRAKSLPTRCAVQFLIPPDDPEALDFFTAIMVEGLPMRDGWTNISFKIFSESDVNPRHGQSQLIPLIQRIGSFNGAIVFSWKNCPLQPVGVPLDTNVIQVALMNAFIESLISPSGRKDVNLITSPIKIFPERNEELPTDMLRIIIPPKE
jgi:hypothetical protein